MKKGKLKILWLIIGIILATMAVLKIDISLANSAHTMTSPLTGEFTLSETSFSHNDYRLAEAQQRLYCIDSTYLIEDDYVNTYRYQFSITINGNNGVISTNTNNPVNGNRALGRFAYYVLGGDTRTYPYGFSETSGGTGQENWTVRQVAIWKNVGGLVDIFGSTVGELFKYGQNENNQRTVHSSKTSQYNAFLQEAQDYANEVQSGNTETVKAELKSNENLNCRNNSIGPIKIDFNGKISKVKVIASDESEITDIEYPTIQSNQNFYITNNSNKEVKKVEITVAPPANATATIKAKIYFYKCTATTCDWRNTATGILSQPVIFAEGTTNEPRPKTVTINVTPEKGKIQVQKSAEKYGNSTPKIKASFVLYNETLQIYPKVTGSGTSYTADNKTSVSAGNAAKIEVDGTKTVTISKLWTGYKYRLVEVSNENPFYQNPIKIDKATGPSGIEVKQVKYNKVEGFWSISKIDAQTASDPINVVVYDKRTRNNLVVRKYGIDDAGDNKEQINLHFKVYDETAKKWIKATLKEEGEDSNEVYRTRYDIDISSDDAQYASGWDSATEFVTSTKNDKIGVTQIRYLLCDHKYTVVETDVDAEYYKPLEIVKADLSGTSLSTGTTTQNNIKYYKVTGITVSNTTTKWVNIYDKKTRTDLKVEKYGLDDSNPAAQTSERINMFFKIYDKTANNGNGQWIKAEKESEDNEKIVYKVKWNDEYEGSGTNHTGATEFVTSSEEGKVKYAVIKGLIANHQYSVVETDVYDKSYKNPMELVKAEFNGNDLGAPRKSNYIKAGWANGKEDGWTHSNVFKLLNTGENKVTFYDRKVRGNLEIEKFGQDDKGSQEDDIVAQFKVLDQETGKYIVAKNVNDGNDANYYEVTSQEAGENDSNTTFETGGTGNKIILKYLLVDHKYTIIEVSNKNPYYNRDIEIKSASQDYGGTPNLTTKTVGGKTYPVVENVTVVNTYKDVANKVKIIDRKTGGDLEIVKDGVDDNGNNKDVIDATFEIYDLTTGEQVKATSVAGDGTANVYEVSENGTETQFTTGGSQHKIIMKYLLVDHQYKVVEVENDNEYYQDIDIINPEMVVGDSSGISIDNAVDKYNTTYHEAITNVPVVNYQGNSLNVHDRKTRGDLEIVKDGVDDNGNSETINATFKIQNETTGNWVIAEDEGNGTYKATGEGSEDQATLITTVNGKAKVRLLSVDCKYKVVEQENDNEYYVDIDIIDPEMGTGDSSGVDTENAVDKYETTYHEAITNVPVVNYQGNSLNVHDRKTRGDLEIVKDGVDDNGNSETINATFKIQNETTGNWVIAEDEGNGTYKATGEGSEDQATLITTVNGKAKVKLLSVDCTYKLVEVSSDNEYYNREIDIRESTVTIENETTEIKLGGEEVRDGTTYHNAVTDVPVKNYTVAGLNIYDRKTAGDLEITKKASDDNENADEIDATFKIYDLTTQKWVIAELENSDNGNVYKATGEGSESQAAEITTGGSSHKARVRLLNVDHQYKVVEVRNTNEYYDRDIDIKDATVTVVSQDVNLGNEVSKYDTTYHEAVTNVPVVNYDVVNLDVHDRKTAGDLEFTKYGRYNDVTDEVIVVGFKIYNETTQEWVIANQVDGDGKANYYEATRETTTDFERATEFRTGGTENKVYVKYLNVDSKYRLVETYSENPYYSDPIDIDSATATTGEANEGTMNIDGVSFEIVSSVTIINTNTNAVRIIDNRTSGDLTLHKIDSMGNVNLQAGFKLYSEKDNAWVTQNSDGTFAYTETDPEKGTTFRTDENGNLELKCLRNTSVINTDEVYYYRIYEVEMPTGYDKTKQYNDNTDEFGYMKDDFSRQYEWVYIGKTTLTTGENTITYTMDDKKVVDHLEGKVFVDNPQGKANDYNNLYDDGEVLLDGIEVHLRDKTRNHEIIATTWTKNGGNYSFDNLEVLNDKNDDYIYYWYLKNYYVEFVYDNQTYITTVPFLDNDISNAQGDAPNEVRDGSRAIEDEISGAKLDDRNLTGTTGNLPGLATTYQGATTDSEGLAKYYDNADYRVKYINLGLKVKLEPKFTVTQNIAYVKATINNYEYTYEYGGTEDKSKVYAPKVRWQSTTDITAFTRKIYPSDIVYNSVPQENPFELYVVYRIDIQNDTAYNIQDLYTEQKMYVSNLINDYDHNRYTLDVSSNISDESEFGNWEVENGHAKYTGSAFSDGLAKHEIKTTYIQFKVTEEALQDVLANNLTIEDLNYPTKATATTYHIYDRNNDYSWVDNISASKRHTSKEYTESGEAPYLILQIDETRNLSGKVFEDSKDDSKANERLGNGIYDEGTESTIGNVKVELLQEDGSGGYRVADLYTNGNIHSAEVFSEKEGENIGKFEFKDVVPGDYYVRYTYGDGSQKIYGVDGTEKGDVPVEKYKSTIVTSEEAKSALKGTGNSFWYIRQGESPKYSTAVDDLYIRKTLTANGTEYGTINADTAMIGIPVEYTEATSGNGQQISNTIETITKETTNEAGAVDENGNTITETTEVKVASDVVENIPEYTNMNFGIIEMPKTELAISKKIVNVKITLSNGQVIVDGNPTQNVKYMTDMGTDGTYVKVELDSQYLYGSTLEIKYAITVTNNSELYYTDNEYYLYGETGASSQEGTVKINKLYDYLDPRLEYKSVDETDVIATMVPLSDENRTLIEATQNEVWNSPKTTRDIVYQEILQIEGTDESHPIAELHTTKGDSEDTEKTITINANRTLSTEDEDLDVVNLAQVVGITTTELIPAIPSDASQEQTGGLGTTPLQPRTDPIVFTITPSTGEDRSNYTYIYVIAGMVILVVGVVIIKKKVL